MPPHVYGLSDRAYRSMKNSKRDQSMVVSGESGAGKTETCKHIMRFMASVGGEGPIGTIDELEQKILDANPVLEAFGNAKTLRNNNSSRFGKFTELYFNGEAHLAGASIETYLLEKSRLVSQMKGERSFHIFYQLMAGAEGSVRAEVKIKDATAFRFLAQSGCATIDGVDDRTEFQQVVRALTNLGISPTEQTRIWCLLSALLYLGNVEFADVGDTAMLSPTSKETLETVSALLGIEPALLLDRVLHRSMKAGAGNETIVITLNAVEAVYARDALAKYIYGQLFDWLVNRINQSVPGTNAARFIGILDISGFEIFDSNSFEQFCINFANEKIQQYFNHQILQQEQEIYEMEGLRFVIFLF